MQLTLSEKIGLQEDRVVGLVRLKYAGGLLNENEFSKDLDDNIENLQLLIEEAKKTC